MRDILLGISASVLVFLLSGVNAVADVKIADFETDQLTWGVPDWALEKADHVAKKVELSSDVASDGKKSLRIDAAFTGQGWTAAVVEVQDYYDLSPSQKIAVDIYLPKDAPEGLTGNIVLTVGDGWTWSEQLRAVPLVPGKWTTVEANIADGSKEWKKTTVDASWRSDIRKVDVRIISDKKAAYNGPIYIDHVRGEGGATNASPVTK